MAAVGFSAAARAALANLDENAQRLRALRDECYARLLENPKVKAAVSVEPGTTAFAPHVVNVLVRGMESETLILQLDRRGFCVSGGRLARLILLIPRMSSRQSALAVMMRWDRFAFPWATPPRQKSLMRSSKRLTMWLARSIQ